MGNFCMNGQTEVSKKLGKFSKPLTLEDITALSSINSSRMNSSRSSLISYGSKCSQESLGLYDEARTSRGRPYLRNVTRKPPARVGRRPVRLIEIVVMSSCGTTEL